MSRFKIALAISTMLVLLFSSAATATTASVAGDFREPMVTNGDLDNGCCHKL